LVVDGDGPSRKELVLRLEILGFEVLEADHAAQALEIVEKSHPGLVITEWGARPFEGPDWLESLAEKAKLVVLFTDRAEAFSGEKCLDSLLFRVEKRMRTDLLKRIMMMYPDIRSEAPSQVPPGDIPSERNFLAVEDSATVRLYLRRALERGFPGCRIQEAKEGVEALEVLGRSEVSLILTDLLMPGMDGESFLERLCRNPIHAEKPVIVLSGNIPGSLVRLLRMKPHYRLIFKPATADKILQIAGELLVAANSSSPIL